MYRDFIKNIFDKVFALLLLIVLSPVFILIILILFISGNGIFFVHSRPGLNAKPFKLIKFKTMKDNVIENNAGPNIVRITKFGNFLRKNSLDEIPQLLNVLKGELSLIGPRPLEMRYLKYYTAEQNRRHEVKPGITGWAQVNGRNSIPWEERFVMDTWYVDNLSFLLDLNILIKTVSKVFKREGINLDSDRTVVPFDTYVLSQKDNNLIR